MRTPDRTPDGAMLRDVAAIGAAMVAVGASFGAMAVAAGLPVWATVAMSTVVYAGGAQFMAVGLVAAALVGAGHAVLIAVRRVRAMVAVRRACSDLPRADRLAVLVSDRPEAFSTPPPAGRVVLSSGLLDRLSPEELRVVLAHEESHLRHGHAWYALAAELAAAANPLLRPIARSVRDRVERWADEDAARAVADRRLAARAVARTA
ncbi:peptidase M48, partial [Micromonospora globispora]|uniref:AzlC family ABC transporter permease n=1 Tax=Micromonospora globispora TaxID=1450148 RepID=UPI000D8EAE8A